MSVLVVDASVLATALADDGPDGDQARATLRGRELAAPELVDLEVASVLRKHLQHGRLEERRARLALTDLADLPMHRASHAALLPRCWTLRENLTMYDASYVALAEELDAAFLTADVRIARAPGVACPVEVLRRPGDGGFR